MIQYSYNKTAGGTNLIQQTEGVHKWDIHELTNRLVLSTENDLTFWRLPLWLVMA